MIKTGIHDIRQVTGGRRFKTLLGRDKILSVTLYDQVLNLPNAEYLAERILLLCTDERGARKRTYASRFDEFDASILQLMREHFATDAALVVEDVGVSDARTSCDFFERLAPDFPRVSYQASDYSPRVLVLDDGRTKVTLSARHKVLEIVYPPFVFNNMSPENPLFYPVNHAVRGLVRRLFVRPLVERYLSGQLRAREVLLFSARALRLSKQDERFRLSQHDLLTPLPSPAGRHIVRAMNVLNPSHFDPQGIRKVLGHVFHGLVDGGWLITGSNQDADSLVSGGVYEKSPGGFRMIWRSGKGSPMESEILSWKPLEAPTSS